MHCWRAGVTQLRMTYACTYFHHVSTYKVNLYVMCKIESQWVLTVPAANYLQVEVDEPLPPRVFQLQVAAAGGVPPLPVMFGLHTGPSLEHGVEKGGSLVVLLSPKRDAVSCELCPSLVAAPELRQFPQRNDSSLSRGL